jgi:uncharacterized membrane protein YgaE (UPF0421/DUF939 family)
MNLFPRIQKYLTAALDRLWDNSWAVIQTAAAASFAYLLAVFFLGGAQPAFYAPIVAIVCLSLTLGQPGRRAILITLGVTVGLTVAYLIVLAIGVGSVQIALVIVLAMATALLFSENTLLVNQAAISAVLVIVLQPPQESGLSPDRFFDALIGGGVALAVNYLFPADPERMMERAMRPVFDQLASSLKEVAAALEYGDLDKAERALSQARGIDEQISGFHNTLTAAQDTARFSPLKRRELRHLELYTAVAERIDLVVRGVRSVTRAAAGLARCSNPVSGPLSEAVLDLARAIQALDAYLENPNDPEDPRRFALDAARKATAALKAYTGDLNAGVLAGQIRTTTIDILMSTCMKQTQAIQALEEAAGSAAEIDCGSSPDR